MNSPKIVPLRDFLVMRQGAMFKPLDLLIILQCQLSTQTCLRVAQAFAQS